MRYDSLVNRVLEEGDELWVELEDGEKVHSTYENHVVESSSLKLETSDGSYRFGESSEAVDFGLSGDDEGFYGVLSDYGTHGRETPDMLSEARGAAELLYDSVEPEKSKVRAD